MKLCPSCATSKPMDAFGVATSKRDGRFCYCIECRRAKDSARVALIRDELRRRQRDRKVYIRLYVLFEYGGRCACCGETEPKMLAIDHIEGGGKKHRNSRDVGRNIATWLVRNGLPDGFRVLCHNCNFARGIFGGCPHESGHSLPTVRNAGSQRNFDRRVSVISAYGGRCVCCGESKYEFLALDHVNGNGSEERRRHGKNLAKFAHDNGCPKTLQLLCHNCNMSKGFYGACPHGTNHQVIEPHPL